MLQINFIKLSFFMVIGGNGKGKFFDIIKAIVGDDLYNCVSLKQLTNDRFAPAELFGKTVNICADDKITSTNIDTEIIKSCLSEDFVNAQIKYGQPFKFKPVATFLIGTNHSLDLDDTSNAIDRRFVVVPMQAKFQEDSEEFDVDIGEKLTAPENLEYIAYKAMLLFSQVMRLRQFPMPDVVKNETNKQLLEFNTVKQFLLDNPFRREKPCELFEQYENYCKENSLEAVSNKKFGMDIKNIKVNGITYRKKKLVDPEDGKYKYYYISSDYNTNETYNPMLSISDEDLYNQLFTAIQTGSMNNEVLLKIQELVNNSFPFSFDLSNVDVSNFELNEPKE